MHLDLSASDLAFRDRVRAFLDARLTDDLRAAAAANTATFCDLETTVRWHRVLHEQGWVAPNWPAEHGGAGWSQTERYIFASECARAGAPAPLVFGLSMCGPVLMRYGTPAQKAAFLPKILSGEHRWCQGYSEPGAGSDLASLQTRALREGDHYVVSGTKIWTTFAHNANWIFCLVRTSTEGRPQEGITFLLIDMSTPGLSVSPLVNIAGDHEFNQLHFDEVRVPVHNRVGEEGGGWTVAKTLLEFERGGSAYGAGLYARIARIARLAAAAGADGASFRRRLAALEVQVAAADMLERRTISALSLGEAPGPAASVMKLQGSELMQALDELAVEAAGPAASLPASQAALAMARYLYDRSMTIYGGTSEVQRNILARAGLGL